MPGIDKQMDALAAHLKTENELLCRAFGHLRDLDKVGRGLGLLSANESLATQISWWPIVSLLGPFSAGKSTFINDYLDATLQETGNHAVDDHFTVICYGKEQQTLPGSALATDPRFPFFKVNEEIMRLTNGGEDRINSYLQLKTCDSEKLRGKLLVDSPGFDADAKRREVLHIADRVLDISDLVLVFFDARHPEPGSMRETLELVKRIQARSDLSKFVFILNQIDCTGKGDDLMRVFGSWKNALAEAGVTTGKLYTIYSPSQAVPIENEAVRARCDAARDRDYADLDRRICGVDVETTYRGVQGLSGAVQHTREIGHSAAELFGKLRKAVVTTECILAVVLLIVCLFASKEGPIRTALAGLWGGSWAWVWRILAIAVLLPICQAIKLTWLRVFKFRHRKAESETERHALVAFERGVRPWFSLLLPSLRGWGRRAQKKVNRLEEIAQALIQELNDRYIAPSRAEEEEAEEPPPEPPRADAPAELKPADES